MKQTADRMKDRSGSCPTPGTHAHTALQRTRLRDRVDKGLDDAAEADQSSGRKGGVLPCPGLPPLAGREGAWSFVLADQGGTRNSVSRSSINLVPSLVYR